MNHKVMFSSKSDEWSTPLAFFETLNEEFHFRTDVAATKENRLCYYYFGPDHELPQMRDALAEDVVWEWPGLAVWCNPPYSMCKEFVAKAVEQQKKGVTTVMLIPSRTDTKYWHTYIWDCKLHQPRPNIQVRFVPGRLKFGGAKNSAPFPSVVVVFKGEIS